MKPWDYYTDVDVPYFTLRDRKIYEQSLRNEINNTPMFASEREQALSQVKKKAHDYAVQQNEPYNQAKAALCEEFWRDAREELNYTELLTPEGVSCIEQKAYERGHAYGFSQIFHELSELVCFAEDILKHRKRD